MRQSLPRILIGVAVLVISISGYAREVYIARQGRGYYALLMEQAPPVWAALPHTTGEAEEAPPLLTAAQPFPDNGRLSAPVAPAMVLETALQAVSRHRCVDFDKLREAIPDLIAWISCDGTNINYPVVQGTDNYFYLKHLPDGKSNKLGSIFADYRCDPSFTGPNTVLYGHHVKTGEMFGSLENYKNPDYYQKHPVITLHHNTGCMEVELFAGYVADASWEILPRDFENDSDFTAYVNEIRRRSVFSSETDITASDRLVTFCTCTYDYKNARFVLVGKIITQ